jgi:hypothetical protein
LRAQIAPIAGNDRPVARRLVRRKRPDKENRQRGKHGDGRDDGPSKRHALTPEQDDQREIGIAAPNSAMPNNAQPR